MTTVSPMAVATPSPAERAALLKAVSADRLGTYVAAAKSGDPLALYLWDRDLAVAVLRDVAILEVALRNAMHAALSTQAGRDDWYAVDIGLDSRSQDAVVAAWSKLPAARRTPGRVVAQLMFGFWRNLLEAGGHAGKGPLQRRCDYELLWRNGLNKAFPGGKADARRAAGHFTRPTTLVTVSAVHALRNRAAHHEPLVDGYPLPGQKDSAGVPVRLTVRDGHGECLKLARLLDRDLASWMGRASRVPALLAVRP